jgi:hypothetical protein
MVRVENLSGKVVAKMRQLQVRKTVKREPTRGDPLPLDPRDADIVRAKQRLYERERPRPTRRAPGS